MSEKLTRTQIKNLERLGGVNPADETYSRRQFARQVGGTAAVAGAAVAAGYLAPRQVGDGGGQAAGAGEAQGLSVAAPPGAAEPGGRPLVPAEAGPGQDIMEAREEQALRMVKRALDEMGGVERFIQKGDVVVIKPNVAFDKNPDLGATTQPDTVSAVVKLCRAAGAAR